MKLQINANSPDSLKTTLECILNIASVFAGNGYIPTQQDQENRQQYGTFWWRENDKIHLHSNANDWWGWITNETETSITLRFTYRLGNSIVPQLAFRIFKFISNFG